jgi:ribonuclease E
MPQQIVIAEQLRIAAVLNDERVDELIVAQGRYQIGDVYLGTVENVLPGIDAAFVNIGESEKNGFIHITDLGPLRLRKGGAGITELLEPRQKVLVQVMKEPTGTKGPRLTGNLALPGRYLVLQPHGQGVTISRRVNGDNERNRLRALGVLIKPPGAGLLVRTEAEGVSEELLIEDLESLLRQWEGIQAAAETASPPVLLNRDEDFIHRILRDLYSQDLVRVVVDSPEGVSRAKAFLGADHGNVLVEAHTAPGEILEAYKVSAAIHDALKPRVDLPSGGYVIIEPTEALTVIDVNSGSFTRSANARETVLWTNCEAAVEIARQLKLRNIGGVVVIDFIDMESRRDQLQVLEHFTQAVRDDAARPQIAQLTELGLVELTRKRQGQNIYELFGRACPSCGGLGHVAVLPGRDSLLPLASAAGLVRSAAAARAEVAAPPATVESGGGRRRRGGRGGRSSADAGDANVFVPVAPLLDQDQSEPARSGPDATRRSEPDVVTVPMDAQQEAVYGWLGLSPALLLEDPPASDAAVVRVVRPGVDPEAVRAEARQELASSGSRRRRGRGGRGAGQTQPGAEGTAECSAGSAESPTETPVVAAVPGANGAGRAETSTGPERSPRRGRSTNPPPSSPAPVEITPLPVQLSPETVVTVSVPTRREEPAMADVATVEAVTAEAVPEEGEPRRRRRRSSAAV